MGVVEEVSFLDVLEEEHFNEEFDNALKFLDSFCADNYTSPSSLFQESRKEDAGAIWTPGFEELPLEEPPLLPSHVEHPKLELKSLPAYLKYVFLGKNCTFPMVVNSNLTPTQEEALIGILLEHKGAIGWTIADIVGISPLTCSHRIYLDVDAKSSRECQRRLNPMLKDVVKGEIIKLLDAGIIYPISDSQWVSPIQVVPKKSGITVVRDKNNELMPIKTTTGWSMCVVYRKLNASTRQDHFPLPFLDQILERVAGWLN